MAYFDVSADSYARFMGRFSTPLAVPFADLGLDGVEPGSRVLDVGSGPGMLTAELARRCGEAQVAAVEPMEIFAEANAAAHPEADVRVASAESLPYEDGRFGATLAQLVVHFMSDPVAGLAEMARVTAPGGRVSACVWDHGGDSGPLSPFWRVVKRSDPSAGEGRLPGATEGDLTDLFTRAGMPGVAETRLTVSVEFPNFDDWWEPFTYGVGPAGAYVTGLDDGGRERLVAALREEHGDAPFTIDASAWAATALR
ncbi:MULTISPECIES: class I SAM-dependent methyltransferase [Nocardioides]|uniref:Class I SAM-dependent methyltransferase n=1 Tax=Nocardioides vastitatis TaxID=2568655 RepID=A0ABW0ZPZ9_9ACTN|nr:methyltransferase domain-containing protein [Nocardioides sp.]THI93022.1 methyltransferase domain-containing protein [Nocardioides sp.]